MLSVCLDTWVHMYMCICMHEMYVHMFCMYHLHVCMYDVYECMKLLSVRVHACIKVNCNANGLTTNVSYPAPYACMYQTYRMYHMHHIYVCMCMRVCMYACMYVST